MSLNDPINNVFDNRDLTRKIFTYFPRTQLLKISIIMILGMSQSSCSLFHGKTKIMIRQSLTYAGL